MLSSIASSVAPSSRRSPPALSSSPSRCPRSRSQTAQAGTDDVSIPEVQPVKKLEAAFPGGNDPAVVAIKADDVRAEPVREAIAELERRALASGQMQAPIEVEASPDHTVATVDIPLAGSGTDSVSKDALSTLRDELLPQTVGQVDGVEYAVTGVTAADQDWSASMTKTAPLVFGFVLLFAFLLLLVSFRSIVVALKAILLNLLSVGAAYGLLVIIFQWGLGENLLGFESNGGIAPWLPMFLFVILFGLSMDYHVFILSRVREAYDRGLSNEQAVAYGIQLDGRRGHQRRHRHGRHLRGLRDDADHRHEGDGDRARRRDPDRRDARPRRAPAGDDEAARRPQLVPAEAALVAAEARPRRWHRGAEAGAGPTAAAAGRVAPTSPEAPTAGHRARPSASPADRSTAEALVRRVAGDRRLAHSDRKGGP